MCIRDSNSILEGIKQLNCQGATIVYTTHYMEEVEQLCSRIMIMDGGKAIATGTKEELKAMIRTGEKITVEVFSLPKEALDGLRQLPGVVDADYEEGRLVIHCTSGAVSYTHLDVYKRQL